MSHDIAKVCLYDYHLAEAFERFRRVTWPSPQNKTGSSAESPSVASDEGGASRDSHPIFVFVKGDNIVGHVGTIPVRVSSHGGTIPAHWIVGFNVVPEHRNSLVGPLLIKEVNRTLDCALSLHVEPPVLRILTGFKWVHAGVLPQYIRVLSAKGVTSNLQLSGVCALAAKTVGLVRVLHSSVVESLIRMIARSGLAFVQSMWIAMTLMLRPRPACAEVHEERGFDEGYDQLWNSVAGKFEACLVRDRIHLQARFGRQPERYRVLACRQEDRLLGYCIVKTKQFLSDLRMGNMKVGTIVDCLFDPEAPAAFQALLDFVMKLCAREGVHAVLCTASHAAVRRLLRANGFLAIPGNLNFAYYNRTNVPLQDIPLEAWHLMRGDSDADQQF